jgi:pimeloyl-ACP methyl ester carboxylesterase
MSISTPTAVASHGSLDVTGGRIHYTVCGSGAPLVFAHGLGGNLNSWQHQVSAFSQNYTCIAYNHRGFAPSEDVTGTPRPEFFATDLLALFDHLDIGKAVIVAQSMGGWTAMELALLAPDRIAGLVLSGTTGSLRHPDIVTLAAADASHEARLCQEENVSPAAGLRLAHEQPALYALYLAIGRQSGNWSRATVRASLDGLRTRDASQFAHLPCPIQAIVGAEDIVCPPRNVEILGAALPDVSLTKVPLAGHSVYFERAAAFNDITLEYLRRIEAR